MYLIIFALGLIKDDLIDDEHEVVREAIRRLPEQTQLDRMFRLKRAVQSHTNRDTLPEAEWTPVDKVIPAAAFYEAMFAHMSYKQIARFAYIRNQLIYLLNPSKHEFF